MIKEPSLLALLPMLIFLILTLRGKNYTMSVGIAAIAGSMIMLQGPVMFATMLVKNLGSTLGQVGLIIMFGAGLGAVMRRAGISEIIANIVVKKIGVNSELKAMAATYMVSMLLVILIGTLNGGNAVVGPLILPIVAGILTPTTVCFLLFNAGLIGVTVGPFYGAVSSALGVSGLSYQEYMLYSAIPYSLVWGIVSFLLAIWLQKKTKAAGEQYDTSEIGEPKDFTPTKRQKKSCVAFLITFAVCLAYGFSIGGSMKYTMVVILLLSAVIGLMIDQPFTASLKDFNSGMGKMAGMFLAFLLTGVMIDMISLGGGWEALSSLILGVIGPDGKYILMVVASFVGGFGVEGAIVTQMEIIQSAFWHIAQSINIPMQVWAIVLIAAVRITSIVYPSANYAAHLGFAHASNMKDLLIAGWITAIIMMAFVPFWGWFLMTFIF